MYSNLFLGIFQLVNATNVFQFVESQPLDSKTMESEMYTWTYWTNVLMFLICPIWWWIIDDLRLNWAKKEQIFDDSDKGLLWDNNDYSNYEAI